ncbi:MAG: hypothetical protein OEL54_02560 [Flavobacteriaceae bacterium]|nr:hypothetical protein [Flavobacteriaceae bacterium]
MLCFKNKSSILCIEGIRKPLANRRAIMRTLPVLINDIHEAIKDFTVWAIKKIPNKKIRFRVARILIPLTHTGISLFPLEVGGTYIDKEGFEILWTLSRDGLWKSSQF